MAKISSYPSDANVTTSDRLIGSDNENSNETKNFSVGDIINLAASIIVPAGGFVPYTGATTNVDLGAFGLTTSYLTSSLGMFIDGAISLNGDEGNTGEVLVSQGPGATPSWSNALSQFVPYTGATGNVDLGTYNLIADNVQANIFQLNSGGILGLYGTLQLNGNPGASGQVLTSSGGGVPTWSDSLTLNGLTLNGQIVINNDISLNGNTGASGELMVSAGAGLPPTWQSISAAVQLPYLSAHSAVQQTATLANTGYAMKFQSVDISNNISVIIDGSGNPTRITPAESGVYNIQFSAQIQRTTGGASATIDIWFRQGGVDIPNSNTSVNIQANAGYLVAAWNFFTYIDVDAANPYVEIMWATTDTDVSLQQAASSAVHPATPSIIVTVNKISN